MGLLIFLLLNSSPIEIEPYHIDRDKQLETIEIEPEPYLGWDNHDWEHKA